MYNIKKLVHFSFKLSWKLLNHSIICASSYWLTICHGNNKYKSYNISWSAFKQRPFILMQKTKQKKKMSGDYYLQDQNGQNCMCTSMLLTASQIALNSVQACHYTILFMCEWERGDKRSEMHTRWPMFLSGVWTHLAWSRESQGLVLVMEWSPSTIMCSKCQQVQFESE